MCVMVEAISVKLKEECEGQNYQKKTWSKVCKKEKV